MTIEERRVADPDQWRALMALPDGLLLQAWKDARDATGLARLQNVGVRGAEMWERLIEGAAASRFGIKRSFEVYQARYPEES